MFVYWDDFSLGCCLCFHDMEVLVLIFNDGDGRVGATVGNQDINVPM